MQSLLKYPRTPHIQGSRLQVGDEDLSQIPFQWLRGRRITVEEKCDGANSAVSFDEKGNLLLQSRGHYLVGGLRERHYNLMKKWASVHRDRFHAVLGCRYVMYGEWLYAKHSIYYDALPHYFMEFDVYDRERGLFLDTEARKDLLSPLPIVSAPVLAQRAFESLAELKSLLGPSAYIRDGHIDRLREYCEANVKCGPSAVRCAETDPSTMMEGLYIKIEEGGCVVDRMKFVRQSFLQCVAASTTHWLDRPIVPNALRYPLDVLYEPVLPKEDWT